MLDIKDFLNKIIKNINGMITVKDKNNKDNTFMKGLQTIIIIIALSYIFATLISVFKVNINLM